MIIWILIFSLLIICMALGLIYLISRFYKMPYVKRMGGEKKPARLFWALLPVLLLCVGLCVFLDSMNMIICVLHLVVFWFVCDWVNYLIEKKRNKKSGSYLIGIVSVAITVGYLCVGWYLAHHVWRTEYVIETDKAVGDFCIVQIADSHIGTTFDGEGFTAHIRTIQEENPDIVVITGDFVDDDTSREDMISACRALRSLKTKYGVYYAFGNHDKGYYDKGKRGYSGKDLIAELEKNNVRVLQDETVLIDNRLYLTGRQDRSEKERGTPRAEMDVLVEKLNADIFTVVLDHQPHDYEAQERAGVDLVLSGHTHGGQLFPINYVGEWTGENDKTYGWEKRGNTNFVVTSGISDWALHFKTGCKSEYVVIKVKEKEKSTRENFRA